MIFLKTLRSHHCRALFKLHRPLDSPSTVTHLIGVLLNSVEPTSHPSIFWRPISFSTHFDQKLDPKPINSQNARGKINEKRKPLDVLFKEAVGLSETLYESESDNEGEAVELKKKFKELEKEIRVLKENKVKGVKKNDEKEKKIYLDDRALKDESSGNLTALFVSKVADKSRNSGEKSLTIKEDSEPGSLASLFSNKPADASRKSGKRVRKGEPMVYKELPPNMVEFARYLYEQGYFKDANFLPRNNFDAACFENNYGREYLKHAAEKFGRDNQEIAKWLSGSELKKVALFGCPSLSKKPIFSAKTLRTFFKIPENTVCSKCVLKESCKFVNQSVWKGNTKNLDLPVVMKVITLYALESVPPELVLPDEIKTSVNRLLEEAVKLSQTVS